MLAYYDNEFDVGAMGEAGIDNVIDQNYFSGRPCVVKSW
jgi:hypothetical protein